MSPLSDERFVRGLPAADDKAGWIQKPQLERTGPDRRFGNYYRGARDDGRAIAGLPLSSAEAAVVAAVRMAYRVAETQIDRSARLARRLREEGDRAVGPDSPQKALDATERIVFRGAMSLLSWLEGVAADRSNPLQRLAAAQYRIAGGLLGLVPRDAHNGGAGSAPEAPRRTKSAGPRLDARHPEDGPPVRIMHTGKDRRAVRVITWSYAGGTGSRQRIPVKFYHVKGTAPAPLEGELVIAGRRSVTLFVTTPQSAPSGRWRAAFCGADGMQLGTMEIML